MKPIRVLTDLRLEVSKLLALNTTTYVRATADMWFFDLAVSQADLCLIIEDELTEYINTMPM